MAGLDDCPVMDLLLPAGSRVVHIGPYETHAAALQQAMHRRRAQLREHGVVYPGETRRPMRAGLAVLGRQPRGRRRVDIGEWQALVAEVNKARKARVCVSTEDFGTAGPEQARRIVADLGGERVHVVAVARRLDKVLPAHWQERIKSHRTRPYESWLRGVLGDDPTDPDYKSVWASHDLPQMVGRWESAVSYDRFHVIVTDDSDVNWLSDVFESLLGLPDGMLRLADRANSSLSANAAELLRRINATFLQRKWPDEVYFRLVQQGMVADLVKGDRAELDQPMPPPPAWAAERIAQLADERIEQLRSLGVRVIGDLDRLRTPPVSAEASVGWPTSISIDAAVRALEGAIRGALALDAAHRKAGRSALDPKVNGATVEAAATAVDLTARPTMDLITELQRRGMDRFAEFRDRIRSGG
jgi:hypothetical protein